jgi:L,D-peptidoglycan transpeptidase YkuD (ErfK/YbiS/YcfS/YnhG family)
MRYNPSMDLIVAPCATGWSAGFADDVWPCAICKGGSTREKREGDGATPIGCWPMRRVLFRPDRVAAPVTVLPASPLSPEDGWCDDPGDTRYNQPVRLPYAGRHERLWREDGLYDILVVLGHNDSPPVAGHGSAIFLHVAGPGYAPTEGCVALAIPDLLTVLQGIGAGSRVCIGTVLCAPSRGDA